MIRRDHGDDWLLIAQPDHAHLAAEIAARWKQLPLAELLIRAIGDHDEGWRDWEREPDVDPATGIPRDFTEMPMQVAADIWRKSIAASAAGEPAHSEALDRLQRLLDARGQSFTPQQAVVVDAVLSYRHGFHINDLQQVLDAEGIDRATTERTCSLLTEAGVLVSRPERRFDLDVPRVGSSPLGGIWVSRHFCYLAEKSREHRGAETAEFRVLDDFLRQQQRLQQDWADDSLQQFAGDELPRLMETGFRYVQFFDRISLWLCCAERTEAATMNLPGGTAFELTPQSPTRITIEPWPLDVRTLDLSVSSRQILSGTYDDEGLRRAMADAPTVELTWTMCGVYDGSEE